MGAVDVDEQEIKLILSSIDPDIDYDNWVTVGMAIHHSLGRSGFDLWDDWSQSGSKYNESAMSKHWHSFGKSDSPRTLATVIAMAESGGYKQPVEFSSDVEFKDTENNNSGLKKTTGFCR